MGVPGLAGLDAHLPTCKSRFPTIEDSTKCVAKIHEGATIEDLWETPESYKRSKYHVHHDDLAGNPLVLTSHNARLLDPVHSAVLLAISNEASRRFNDAGLHKLESLARESMGA